jgi:serine/threonine protein phosphatase PrpC
MTSAEAIEYVYRKVVIRKVPPQDVARKLVTKAIRMGSDDNCTALVVFFTQW